MTQKRYTPEFREQIAELCINKGKSFAQIELKYGVSRSTLYRWKKNYAQIERSSEKTTTVEEYQMLQERIYKLEEEKEILAKAVGIFAAKM